MSMLEVNEAHLSYHRRGRAPVHAVVGASLAVERGQIVGLVGESGCGKSSLARACVGLTKISSGSIIFDGEPVAPLTRRARPRAQRGLQMVFQNPYASLNPRRPIGSQISDALKMAGTNRKPGELLDLVGLSESVAARYPHEFSGGQRQRIAIARALAAEPQILVLDEPLSSLDASAQAQVANLLEQLAGELNIGMLLISHDLSIVRYLATEIVVMYLGVVVESGPTEAVWAEPDHPYTRSLIGAIPVVDGTKNLPLELLGDVGDPADPPPGCRFHLRCPIAIDRCAEEVPELLRIGERASACLLSHSRQEVSA
jgi:oligopeptide/dipeptide ABC transporter ATP-binding protein